MTAKVQSVLTGKPLLIVLSILSGSGAGLLTSRSTEAAPLIPVERVEKIETRLDKIDEALTRLSVLEATNSIEHKAVVDRLDAISNKLDNLQEKK